jgi:hypothetical protein
MHQHISQADKQRYFSLLLLLWFHRKRERERYLISLAEAWYEFWIGFRSLGIFGFWKLESSRHSLNNHKSQFGADYFANHLLGCGGSVLFYFSRLIHFNLGDFTFSLYG